ncbi:MAG: rubredoxin [Clostridiales bacterium]|nr:rubredoxin [Clostridiales bacterium]
MVCGYEYDEAAGDKSQGIAPGTKWEDLPEGWVCPICGADKTLFELAGGEQVQAARPAAGARAPEQKKGMSALEQAILCSNLAKAGDKQHNAPLASLFDRLAQYFEAASVPEGDLEGASKLVNEDIASRYVAAFNTGREIGDRGALRALTWGEKVTKIQANLLGRYLKEGDAAFESSKLFVCEACGFIYAGAEAPEICPVCKVPRFKFNKVKRGA